ncbi:CorA family divalent cation transporter [Pseudovibrio sp. SPO723]|uniref:CorA family divalent cation transporter n=1 Tax=Nesiotobacter zosterae TaxID=392721 RepID=UPI0029C1D6F9|nr:CorA family divalent cation transporter [Pseudovibrio sp. SPO723]MDX5595020.1 CorA family divalent cation transporter [Pseudovibrio sp. SPO723]
MERVRSREQTVFAFEISADGVLHETAVEDVIDAHLGASKGVHWLHVKQEGNSAEALLNQLPLDADLIESLKSADALPRCTIFAQGVLLNLFVFKELDQSFLPDLAVLRMWVSERLVVSVCDDKSGIIPALGEEVKRGLRLHNAAELVSFIALSLADRAEPLFEALSDRIENMEDLVLLKALQPWETELAHIRRTATMIRRSLFTQRDAIRGFEIENMALMSRAAQVRLREAADRITRIAEEMDAIRERAEIVHDQVMFNRAEQTNRYMLMLAVVAAVFLPLSLITGLLGINVGGIPGAHSPYGFVVVCLLLLAVVALQIYIVRRLKIL